MASEKETSGKGTYLYAVVSGISNPDFGAIGLSESKVYTVANESGDLVAVVSDIETKGELRPERKNLAEHQRVLRRTLESSRVVLPVSFGTVADGPEGIRGLLSRYQGELQDQMRRVEGKVEMAARTYYRAEQPTVFDFFLGKNPELARLRDQLIAVGPAPSRDAKIEMGQLFERVLNSARDEYAGTLETALGPFCAEVKRNPPRNEKEMVRLACLVPKEKQADFEAALAKAAEDLPDELTIEQNGPFPPYDFIELHLQV